MSEINTSSETESFRAKILLATPNMGDPRFSFTVIFVVGHDHTGAMGLVINKPKDDFLISDLLEQVGIEGDVKVVDTPVLDGGPVDIDRGFVLHSLDYFTEQSSLKVSETLAMTSTKDVLEALVTDAAPEKAIMAVGYAGWGPGQLEAEIADNAWLILDGTDSLIFSGNMDGKWASALSEMGIEPSSLSQSGGTA